MSIVEKDFIASPPPTMPLTQAASAIPSRQRVAAPVSSRVHCDGKFFRLGTEKFYVRGVTYGPFALNDDGDPLPPREQVEKDFALIRELSANCIRIYHTPPKWFLHLAERHELRIFLDVAWPKNLAFVENDDLLNQARAAVSSAAKACGNHPAVFAISVVNEIPADLVRFYGRKRVEAVIDELIDCVKREAPRCLVTFANFPTTEYLQPRKIDFACFNVYLHDEQVFRNYLARLQNIAGELPLMLGEYGIDTHREKCEAEQATILSGHVRAVFEEGLAGTFIFSFTDDWHTHGWQITDWKFGVVRADRSPKPAFATVAALYRRVPQVSDLALPKVSVIICSYNGGSTIESCLRSMERIRYPDFEIIFVDDGSTDCTPQILERFPQVRTIRQPNLGLSSARNSGLNSATGEIIVYTDSDCEADEDWLYYLVLSLLRSSHVGTGGPNLIPDEGSWIADCVGLSPGGPTHVMLDDRTAEHVPGCNMAFYARAAKAINGFDSQFRRAGDDVDFIWRLQHLGYTIGFSPAAQVWHYRRNTVNAYLKQQRGYGEAEALLKFKHPDHFNVLGASHWRGRIYGGDGIGVRLGRDVIYHGIFGSGLFQTIYRKQTPMLATMLMSIEWHLLYAFVALVGFAYPPLWIVALLMMAMPIALAVLAAVQAPVPRNYHPLTRPMLAYLHFRQPITRGWARYAVRLRAKIIRRSSRPHIHARSLPLEPNTPCTLQYWDTSRDRITLLQQIRADMQIAGWRMRLDSGWNDWDIEIYGSRYVKVRITTMSEHHDGKGLLTRVRVKPLPSPFCGVLMIASVVASILLLIYLRPFAWPALLLPLPLAVLYLVNKSSVLTPVLHLIDDCARHRGYLPLLPKGSNIDASAPVATAELNPSIA